MSLSYLIKAGRVISDFEIHEKVNIGVQDGRIKGFVPEDAAADQVIDLSDHTVLPGLIDLHIHFGPEVEGHIYARLMESRNEKLIKSVVDARNLLLAGFTTARDLGGRCAISLRNCIDHGEIVGPRLKCSGRGLTSTGGTEDYRYTTVDTVKELSDCVQVADGPDGCRKAVRDQYRLGADLIKIFVNGLEVEERYSEAEIVATVDEANRLGLAVAVHAQGGNVLKQAVTAGCQTIEHGTYLDEEGCLLMHDHGVVFVPTLAFHAKYAIEGVKHGTPPDDPQSAPQRLPRMMESVKMAHELGVVIGTGSDYGFRSFLRHGAHNADEIVLLTQAGLTPMDALMAATLNGAKALRMTDQIGAINAGLVADLVAMPGNPLEDIDVVKQVDFVMKDGRVLRTPSERGAFNAA
jgi:imidazolonepropionase-like amidohydrolase